MAYSGVNGSPDAWEMDQDRSAAKATTDIVWHGRLGRLAAVERLIRNRVLECLPAAISQNGPIVATLYAGGAIDVESAEGVETDGGAVRAEPTDPQQTRERHNRLHYEQTAFCGHRGMEIGTRVPPNTGLWNHMLSRARRESGERLWEPDSKIEGTLMKLVPGGEEDVATIIAPGATHAVTWHTAASRWEGRHEAVHLLDPHELEQIRNRVTGPLLASAVERARDGEREDDDPLARAAAEYAARGTLPGRPEQG